MIRFKSKLLQVIIFLIIAGFSYAAPKKKISLPPLYWDNRMNRLVYSVDSLGNRIPDFSYCGYMAGELAIPTVPIRVVVPVVNDDATLRIQSAIDFVAGLPADKNGIKGAVLLKKGIYKVNGCLKINSSGVILRGSGVGKDGTILLGTGKSRETLIQVAGKKDIKLEPEIKIDNSYVPVNSFVLRIKSANSFKIGDQVRIHRPCTQNWINTLGTDHFGGGITYLAWKPGDRDLFWDRKIINADKNSITLDAPLTTALDSVFGGGLIAKYNFSGRISQVGIENLSCQSEFDVNNSKDEDHRWMAITIENCTDSWVRQVVFEHFAGSAVAIWNTGQRITVEDCKSLVPISEIGGQRRNTFLTMGQQTLFQRCYAEFGYHDFAVGACAAGPNAFVQCESHLPFSFSGAIDSWSSGVLFDIVYVERQSLKFCNLGQDAQGAGWTTANSVFWQCTASRIDCYKPPTAQNWAFGSWAEFSGDGYWNGSNDNIDPRSLYYAQLAERLGVDICKRAYVLPVGTEGCSSPTIEAALNYTKESSVPHLQLKDYIDLASKRDSIPIVDNGIVTIDKIGVEKTSHQIQAPVMKIKNGWIVRGEAILTGQRVGVPWWKMNMRPRSIENSEHAITRYVPGRTGTGFTDDLNEVTDLMKKSRVIGMEQNYALWYDRRRDDHERIPRLNGDVWLPFYEVPFARSGQGIAWDGLSLYDLSKYNLWYWSRLKQFADLADQKGLLLINQNFFQHNIIEDGAHWADCAWRTANNINDTGFPEPPPYAGDKRIFMSGLFYDTTNIVRNSLYKAYIRQCLENFKENNGVIQLIGAEFTGPFSFVKFWLQTIEAWEKEKGIKEMIGLSVTKDVQDSVLANPQLASIVDVIDIRQWSYRNDGSLFAPQGGKNLAPRQHKRLIKTGKRSFEQIYRAVREYRLKFPDKAVIYSEDESDSLAWAVFMAGGSLAAIPNISDKQFLVVAATMLPEDLKSSPKGQWMLADKSNGFIVYTNGSEKIKLDLSDIKGSYIIKWIDPLTGVIQKEKYNIKSGKLVELETPGSGAWVAWLKKE